jgi:hypothetical protein
MADKWRAEFKRLQNHRTILQGKLAIPSNEATRASLGAHLARVEDKLSRHMDAAFIEADRERNADPIGRELDLRAEHKRYGKYWSRERREEYREELRDLRVEQDTGIRLPKWTPPAPGWEERLRAVLAKYARVPAALPGGAA